MNNQKLLIISPHADKIEQQIKTIKLQKLYGFDVFTNCEFCFIKFNTWCTDIQTQIVDKLGDFDIALCEVVVYMDLSFQIIFMV